MKKTILTPFFFFVFLVAFGQNYYMSKPEGFGAAATGGGNATPITVTTYDEFKAAIKLTTPQVILVSGTINCSYTSETLTNKTIIGLKGARLVNTNQTATGSGILYLKPGSNNVIIRNLIFEGPGAYDVDGRDNLTSECTNLWVDHCEFQDGTDGNFDNKGAGDNTTISWCKFTYLKPAKAGGPGGADDHRFTNLVGSSKSDFPADGHYSITFQNCYWAEGCKERMPRARNAELHLLNCYYNTSVSGSLAIGLGGGNNNTTCYVENTNFANIASVYRNYNSTDGGSVGLIFDGCMNGSTNVGSVSKPSYAYTVLPVAEVATAVANGNCGAGATLNVTTTGVISSGCASLGQNESKLSKVQFYPTLVDSMLTVELPESMEGLANIEVFSTSGAQVFLWSKKVNAAEKIALNLSTLPKGLYLCTLKIASNGTTWKFIKK
ncbi:Pectate lyase [Flavobacterium sp. 9R]|uniref:pectate lyase family protein n=1 Tax=Flavobacterium sp. 9R TaxID=2653143 RepID=UPI0012EF1C27|nr:T9SS type A sorting domain-containing protein [Flavobacterium sp. 9R]VXC06402.1 Pectate lyase [Flavobacterium sp. 9R]